MCIQPHARHISVSSRFASSASPVTYLSLPLLVWFHLIKITRYAPRCKLPICGRPNSNPLILLVACIYRADRTGSIGNMARDTGTKWMLCCVTWRCVKNPSIIIIDATFPLPNKHEFT